MRRKAQHYELFLALGMFLSEDTPRSYFQLEMIRFAQNNTQKKKVTNVL